LYIYSKVNYKTFMGKSTKIRLNYRDLSSVARVKQDSIKIVVEVVRQVGQDLRSQGSANYKIPSEYTLIKFNHT
jgi:hypothetical protein